MYEMGRPHMCWIHLRDTFCITKGRTALAASLCVVTGNGPTGHSETILLGRFASTPKAPKTLLQDYIYTAELRARGMDEKQVHFEVTRRLGTKDFPNPARTGVAYMIAPVMRGWTDRAEPVTMNMPHYMFYAPQC